jgi:hypothetical protein
MPRRHMTFVKASAGRSTGDELEAGAGLAGTGTPVLCMEHDSPWNKGYNEAFNVRHSAMNS